MEIKNITAPFRWAGSKAKLTNRLFEKFIEKEVYVEPFLGSGVVLFRLIQLKKYKRYIVNDVNISIISLYKELQLNADLVIDKLTTIMEQYNNIEDKEDFYYSIRNEFNKDKSKYEYFWMLMKSGFNGLYRENKKGEYNVPFGKKNKITLDITQLKDIHNLIQGVDFFCEDYESFCNRLANEYDTFIYNDPPYCQSQQYTSTKFDNKKLAEYMETQECSVAISDIDSINSNAIYSNFHKNIISDVKRVISIANIKNVQEVLYTNYIV